MAAAHWHKAERLKCCILCNEDKPLSEFYAYAYTTTQGKRSTRYESRCRSCSVVRARQRNADQPGLASRQSKAWRAANRGKHLEGLDRYRISDAGKSLRARHQRLRKARCRSGQGDNEAIRAIYAEAMRIEALVRNCPLFDIPELGHKMHVDHIRPLAKRGKHHESNLQIIPIGINMRKGVKYCASN